MSTFIFGFFLALTAAAVDYPSLPVPARTEVDTIHGISVSDPYRGLEEKSDTVRTWAEAQDKVARTAIQGSAKYKRVHSLLANEFARSTRGVPDTRGSWIFGMTRTGEKPGILVRENAKTRERLNFLDPLKLDPSGDTQIYTFVLSPTGTYVAIGFRLRGSDWTRWQVYNSATQTPVGAPAHGTKWEYARWTAGEEGLLLPRFPREFWDTDLKTKNQSIWFRRLGSDGSSDVELFSPEDPGQVTFAYNSDDGKTLIYQVRQSSDPNAKIFIQKMDKTAFSSTTAVKAIRSRPLTTLVSDFRFEAGYIGATEEEVFITTTDKAARGRLVALPLVAGAPSREVVPEQAGVLMSTSLVGTTVITIHRQNGEDTARAWTLAGKPLAMEGLPNRGVLSGFYSNPQGTETYFGHSDALRPMSIHKLSLASAKLTTSTWWAQKSPLKPESYITKVEKVTADDGVIVDVTVTEPAKFKPNSPTLLQGYGCYGSVRGGGYDILDSVWLQLGGRVAYAHIRGGGENGEDWHHAAIGAKKVRSILDFLAVAKSISGPKVAIGGSCGGLLVAAAVLREPSLFRGALVRYGILDLARFAKFSSGALWATEIGDAEDPDQFSKLMALSPLHNVPKEAAVPPMLIYHGWNDIRVPPLHSLKLLATLQNNAKGGPFYYLHEPKGGHGAPAPDRRLELWSTELAFGWDSATAAPSPKPETSAPR